jgi:hypothetical protein
VAYNACWNDSFTWNGMKIGSIVIHCYEFTKMLHFWQEALHYVPREAATDSWVILTDPKQQGPNISLSKAEEPHTGKRSRLHLDLYTNSQEKEVERLLEIGAKKYNWDYKAGDDFIVLADPDDNLFCVVQLPEGK